MTFYLRAEHPLPGEIDFVAKDIYTTCGRWPKDAVLYLDASRREELNAWA